MLTAKSIEHVSTVIKFSELFRVSVFTWKDEEKIGRKLSESTSVSQRFIFLVLTGYLYCEALYQLRSVVQEGVNMLTYFSELYI